MKLCLGTMWIIDDEEEFLASFDSAPEVFTHTKSEESGAVLWFFDVAYLDWEQGTATVLFKSHDTPEYEGYALTVSGKRTAGGGWEVSTFRKVEGEPSREDTT